MPNLHKLEYRVFEIEFIVRHFMNHFDETLDKASNGRAVRWPFRVLAAVLLAATLFGFFGAIYRGVNIGDLKGMLDAVVTFPLVTLLCRLAGYAVWKGRVLRNPFWPFASGTVTLIWIVLFLVIVLQHA
jgi:hypothetical protein